MLVTRRPGRYESNGVAGQARVRWACTMGTGCNPSGPAAEARIRGLGRGGGGGGGGEGGRDSGERARHGGGGGDGGRRRGRDGRGDDARRHTGAATGSCVSQVRRGGAFLAAARRHAIPCGSSSISAWRREAGGAGLRRAAQAPVRAKPRCASTPRPPARPPAPPAGTVTAARQGEATTRHALTGQGALRARTRRKPISISPRGQATGWGGPATGQPRDSHGTSHKQPQTATNSHRTATGQPQDGHTAAHTAASGLASCPPPTTTGHGRANFCPRRWSFCSAHLQMHTRKPAGLV